MRKFNLWMFALSLASSASYASTVCGVVRGFPMFSIVGANETLTLVTSVPAILKKIENSVGAYACVSGTRTPEVYNGFRVSNIITDETSLAGNYYCEEQSSQPRIWLTFSQLGPNAEVRLGDFTVRKPKWLYEVRTANYIKSLDLTSYALEFKGSEVGRPSRLPISLTLIQESATTASLGFLTLLINSRQIQLNCSSR